MAVSVGQFSSQVTSTQLEQVRKKLQQLLALNESPFAKLFNQKSEKHQVSAWTAGSGAVLAWRVPVLQWVGGDYQAISLDAGDLGSGSMMSTQYMTFGYFANDLAYGIPALAAMATKTATQAMNNTLKYSLGNAFKELAINNEIGMFQDNTGVLATGAGTGSPSVSGGLVTYNLESAAFGSNRLRGQNTLLDIYDSGNVLRLIGARVSSLNLNVTAPTVTLSVGSYTPHNTDLLAFPGMGATVGTSTLGAGSWRNGIYTFSTTNTTGTLGGLAYSTVYELACCTVNANNGFYTPSVIFSGRSQLVQRRDDDAINGAIGVCHQAQRVSWYLQGITIANQFLRPGDAAKSVDLAGQGVRYGDTFDAGDITHHVSRYANKSRVDVVIPQNYGNVQLDEIDFFRTPEGQRVFVGHNSATGNPVAGFNFYVVNSRQLYCVDPGANIVNYNLALPAGF